MMQPHEYDAMDAAAAKPTPCRWFHKWRLMGGHLFVGSKRMVTLRCEKCRQTKEVAA